jgi:predicted nucleotidyltransferase component of viral defense system
MTKRPLKNIAASVRQRLLNVAKSRGEELQPILTRFALERLLYRLGKSPHQETLVLKGAFLFLAWGEAASRPTKDIDFLAVGEAEVKRWVDLVKAICAITDPSDGLEYDADSVRGAPIREQAIHDGIRIHLLAHLANALIPLQIDIGFGDATIPAPAKILYPTILDLPAPSILAYRMESVIAEKLEALVSIGQATSRLKDFFDIWRFSSNFSFGGRLLQQAVISTFERRRTPIPDDVPFALREEFSTSTDRRRQWDQLIARFAAQEAIPSLPDICEEILGFVAPIFSSIQSGRSFSGSWSPGGPWNFDDR